MGERRSGRARLGWLVVVPVLLTLAQRNPCGAAERANDDTRDAKRWELEVLPYVWIPGNTGTVEVRGRTARVDVSVKDSLDLATGGNAFTGSGYFELRRDRLFTYLDGFGGYIDEHATVMRQLQSLRPLTIVGVDARVKLKPAFIDVGAGYRVGEWSLPNRKRPLTLGLFAGARYYYFYSRVRAAANVNVTLPRQSAAVHRAVDTSKSFDWADPVIGLRWDLPLLDCLTLEFRGDIGGFTAGSDLAWNLVSGLRYWPSTTIFSAHPWIGAGYRALGYDYVATSDSEVDLQFRGPYAGLGLRF